MKGKLASGFSFTVDENIINSWAMLEALNEAQDNGLRIIKVVNMLLGEEQKAKLIKHLGGAPSVEDMSNAITEIFNAIRESKLKNS